MVQSRPTLAITLSCFFGLGCRLGDGQVGVQDAGLSEQVGHQPPSPLFITPLLYSIYSIHLLHFGHHSICLILYQTKLETK
jgi:hypothetical protein